MAISIAQTTELMSFPVRGQRKTLEPDGIAAFFRSNTSDASGGNHLLTVRAPTSHVYVLKNFSVEADGGTVPGQAELLLRSFLVADAMAITEQDFYQAFAFATIAGITTRFVPTTGVIHQIQTGAAGLILGTMARSTTAANGILVCSVENIGVAQTLSWTGQFWAYRREALTVPGTLEALARGLVR